MRIEVKKFLFIGTKEIKNAFFAKAQEKGIIDFIDISGSLSKEVPRDIEKISQALKILKKLPTIKEQETPSDQSAESLSQEILFLHQKQENLLEKKRILSLDIARIEVFGNFDLASVKAVEQEAQRKIQFYSGKSGIFSQSTMPEELLFIATQNGLDYFVGINKEATSYPQLVEMKIDSSLKEQKQKLHDAQESISSYHRRLNALQKYYHFLHHSLIKKLDAFSLICAQGNVNYEMNKSLFSVQGWVPKNKILELNQLVQEFDLFYDEILIEETDAKPTYLENKGASKIGEDLVHIYDTPSNQDKDPSIWVLFFFALFFAFIVGDGGYGFIFLAVALFLKFKYKNAKNVGKRVINLVMILAFSCITWGLLTSSFFGISISPDNPIKKVSLINYLVEKKVEYHHTKNDKTYLEWEQKFPAMKNTKSVQETISAASSVKNGEKGHEMYSSFSDSIMLELALLVGIIHICFSLTRYLTRNYVGFGWILFIIGAYLYFPYYLEAPSMLSYVFGFDEKSLGTVGLYLLATGLSLAVIISIIQNKFLGLLEAMTVIQVFSDILSYLRLYALGLAGGIVSATVNDLANSVFFVAGIAIIILGHAINIALSVMGGVIHGLRLNFLEWYHYSFEGGGKMFNPLRKLENE